MGRSPEWKSGNIWVNCQRCGFTYRQSEVNKEWTGLIVCKEHCWEPRHPQDFVKAIKDDQSPKGLHNSDPDIVEVPTGTVTEGLPSPL